MGEVLAIAPRSLSQDEIDALADRMAAIALTSWIEGASPWQMRHWMRTSLYRHLNQNAPLEGPDPEPPPPRGYVPTTRNGLA
jgi:hypothetical protein